MSQKMQIASPDRSDSSSPQEGEEKKREDRSPSRFFILVFGIPLLLAIALGILMRLSN